MNTHDIPKGIQGRDPAVYERLMETYSKLLWTIAAGILSGSGSREDVEEVVADVFIGLWEHPETYQPQRGGIRTFLCLRVRSLALDRLRQLLGRSAVSLEDCSPAEPVIDLDAQDTVLAVKAYLDGLPAPDREILTLRLLYELKPALIAAKLQLPVSLVYERIRRGRTRLIQTLWETEE